MPPPPTVSNANAAGVPSPPTGRNVASGQRPPPQLSRGVHEYSTAIQKTLDTALLHTLVDRVFNAQQAPPCSFRSPPLLVHTIVTSTNSPYQDNSPSNSQDPSSADGWGRRCGLLGGLRGRTWLLCFVVFVGGGEKGRSARKLSNNYPLECKK